MTAKDIIEQRERIENVFLFGKENPTLEEMREATVAEMRKLFLLYCLGVVTVVICVIGIGTLLR